jgi:predicted phage tail protein
MVHIDPEGVRFTVRKGSKGSQSSTYTPTDSPNTLRSLATASILEVLSEGVIKGFHTHSTYDGSSIFLDNTPLTNPAGSNNFRVPNLQMLHGMPDQDPLPGFPDSENEVDVGIEMLAEEQLVRAISPGVDAVRVIVQVAALFSTTTQGDVYGSEVSFELYYSVSGGGWVPVNQYDIAGKTTSPYQRAVTFSLPPGAEGVEIMVMRATPNPSNDQTQNQLTWVGYVEIVSAVLKYDDTAIVGIQLDSHYFPNIPTRAYWLDGIMVQIPSNYDPLARTYSGDWDGTFKVDWTNNPAWVLYDLITNSRYGCGRDIDATMIDKWSFYEAAQYNDGSVPDGHGTGGTEPRFCCNCVINTQQDAFVVLNAVASSMRALLYYSNGTIGLVQDRPQPSPTRLFGPANVAGGLFDYAGTDYRSMFTAASITWNNPDELYNVNVELVIDAALMSQQQYRETPQTAFGCTSRGQAIRLGRWLIYTSQFETELVTIKTGLENADVRPGDLVLINDPSRAGARLAGRTLDDTGANTLTLDRAAPEIAAGWTIYLTIGSAGDASTTPPTIVACTVTAAGPPLTVTGKPATVTPGTMWLAADPTVEPTPWRVLSIKDSGSGAFEILASAYDAGKYEYVDLGVKIAPPNYSVIPTGPLLGPTNISVQEYIYRDASGTVQFGAVFSWSNSTDPRVAFYQLELDGPNYDTRQFRHISGSSQDVPALRQGTWTISISAVDNIGRVSTPFSETYTTIGLSQKPQPPEALTASVNGPLLTLFWVPTGEIDVDYYWLQWHPATDGSASWAKSTTIAPRVSYQTTQLTVPARSGTYFVKSIDSLGQESATAAEVIVYSVAIAQNQIVDIVEQPAWTGTLGLWTDSGVEIVLAPPAVAEVVPPGIFPGTRGTALNAQATRVGYYGFAGSFDMGAVGDVQLAATLEAYGLQGDVTMSTWVPLATAVPLAIGDSNYWDAGIEVAVSLDGTTFGEWKPLQSFSAQARAFEFRLVGLLYDLQTSLHVLRAEVELNVPDRNESGSNVPFDSTGQAAVSYTTPFFAVPNLQFTAFSPGPQGTSVQILTSTKYGFTCRQVRDNGLAVAGGSFNWLATGYGVSG